MYKKYIFLIIFCFNFFSCASYADSTGNKLVFIRGDILNAYYNNEYKTIKRAEIFYGFGWLDKSKVFIAYQDPEFTEAVAILEIIDLDKNITKKLISIGGVGESNFDVNSDTGNVVYNDSNGVHVLVINKNYSFSTHDVLKGDNVLGVFWVNANIIGLSMFDKGSVIFEKIKINKKIGPDQ